MAREHLLLLTLLSALCATSGFVVPALSPVVFVGFAPLLYGLMISAPRTGPLLAAGMLLGGAMSATAFYPIFWHILPLEWAGLDGASAEATVFGVWVYFMGLGALGMAFFPIAYRRCETGGLTDVLLLPCLWVLFEFLTGIVFALGVYAPQVTLSPTLSLGALSGVGLLASDEPGVLRVAAFGGVYGLSFAVVLCNALLAHTARSVRRGEGVGRALRALGVLALAWAAARLTLPAPAPDAGPTTSVALISTRSPSLTPHASKADPEFTARVQALWSEASDASLLVFPEGTAAFTPNALERLGQQDPVPDNTVLDSRAVKDPSTGVLRRALEALDTGDMTYRTRYKRFLVPVGEYTPASFVAIARLVGGGALLTRLGAFRSYVSGPDAPPIRTRHGTLGVHFCEEVLSPSLYRKDAARGADLLVNIASHNWYHDSRAVFDRMKRAARIRAAETHRYLLVASDTSPSYVLDPSGRTVSQSPWGVETVVRAEVPRLQTRTVYVLLGPRVLLFPLAFCLVIRTRRTRKSPIEPAGGG